MKQTSHLSVPILIDSVFTASFLLAVVCDASTPNPEVHTAAGDLYSKITSPAP